MTGSRRAVRGREVAAVYTVVVVVVALVLAALPAAQRAQFVLDSSTNLVNLRHRPLLVLCLSAFVVPTFPGLWLVPLLAWGYGAVQRWLGAACAVAVGALGHVTATLLVAVLLVGGIDQGRVPLAVARTSDVGVSYGLATVGGLLLARVPRRLAPVYGAGLSALLVLRLLLGRTFTDLGHLTAWSLGLLLALLASRAQRDALRKLPAAPGSG